MKVFGKVILTEEELNDKVVLGYNEGFDAGVKKGEVASKKRLEDLEKSVEKKNKEIERLKEDAQEAEESANRQIERLEAKIEVLEDERDDVREVVKKTMENEDLTAVLTAKKEGLDKREAKLKDRESKVGQEEEGEYKRGYADGVADGVRKINEITAGDRENAMKVAMVAAASHSTPEVVREVTNVKGLASGIENQEG